MPKEKVQDTHAYSCKSRTGIDNLVCNENAFATAGIDGYCGLLPFHRRPFMQTVPDRGRAYRKAGDFSVLIFPDCSKPL